VSPPARTFDPAVYDAPMSDPPASDAPVPDAPVRDAPEFDAPEFDAPEFDAVVLAGGRAIRAGGIDKPGLRVGGRTLVGSVVAAAVSAGARRVIVVGPARPELTGIRPAPPAGLLFAREDPPGAGPVPALRTAMPMVSAPVLALLAGDTPFLTARQLRPLLAVADPAGKRWPPSSGTPASKGISAVADGAADEDRQTDGGNSAGGSGPADQAGAAGGGGISGRADPTEGEGRVGALLLDDGGQPQWLAGCWRTASLAAALAGYDGRSLRGLLGPLRPVMLPCPRVPGEPPPWLDCDTAEELALARRWAGEPECTAPEREG
jgi:molybdopterin-guanine dinucleotide biosynthesis protein A